MKYKAVLFDLDGTLLDYRQAQRNATDTVDEFKLVNSPEVQGYESRGVPAPGSEKMKLAFSTHFVTADPVTFLRKYFQRLSQEGIPIPGAEKLLVQLAGKTKLAVVSNGPGAVQNPRLEKAGLAHFFPDRFYSRDMGIAKPDPEILRIAMQALGVEAEETLFIGDSTSSDQPAAEAAGVDFILFKGSFKTPGILSLLVPHQIDSQHSFNGK